MNKRSALNYIKDSIKFDVKHGWKDWLIDAPIHEENKISQIDDLYECWNATNLQQLLNNMIA